MTLEIDRIQAICFDVDGTLSDTDDQIIHRVEKFLKFLRIIYSMAKIKTVARRIVMALESPINWIYELLDRLGMDAVMTKMMDSFADKRKNRSYPLIPGILKALEELSIKYPLGVVSAREELSTFEFLHKFNLEKYFKVVVTSQTCRHAKPFPDPLLYAAEKLKVKPQTCLMVGDTTVDIKTGKRAGAQTVGVLCGFGTQDELVKAGADSILPSTIDLPSLFQ